MEWGFGCSPGTQSKQREDSLAIRICLQIRGALSFLAIEYVRSNHNAANDSPDDTERVPEFKLCKRYGIVTTAGAMCGSTLSLIHI